MFGGGPPGGWRGGPLEAADRRAASAFPAAGGGFPRPPFAGRGGPPFRPRMPPFAARPDMDMGFRGGPGRGMRRGGGPARFPHPMHEQDMMGGDEAFDGAPEAGMDGGPHWAGRGRVGGVGGGERPPMRGAFPRGGGFRGGGHWQGEQHLQDQGHVQPNEGFRLDNEEQHRANLLSDVHQQNAGNAFFNEAASSVQNRGEVDVRPFSQRDAPRHVAAAPVGPVGRGDDRARATHGEEEPFFDESLVLLDWYNSDLNLKIDPTDFCSATVMSERGFAMLWAGVRATYGATMGKVCFEVRIDSNASAAHLENEPCPNVLRCGWSLNATSLQLGEEPLSFGYGGTAKSSTRCVFRDYGVQFGVGDVIGCFLDMTMDPVEMSFSVNGRDQGVAFRVSRSELGGQALFPHVLSKNQNFSVNFGQMPAPMASLVPGFMPIGQLDLGDGLARGSRPPPSRADCEPSWSGKTHWATEFSRRFPEKKFNILGTNTLLDRMKVNGLPRKRNYHGRWDVLIGTCTQCFDEMLQLAAKRRRNYIIDQTNVFGTARLRKMQNFEGFLCKIIVVLPNDQEWKRRVALREAVEGKDVPDEAIMEMKANFILPDVEETYAKEVLYTELGPKEASDLVMAYNMEANASGVQMTNGGKGLMQRNAKTRQRLGIAGPIGRHILDLIAGPSTSRFAGPPNSNATHPPDHRSRSQERDRARDRDRERDRDKGRDRDRDRDRDRGRDGERHHRGDDEREGRGSRGGRRMRSRSRSRSRGRRNRNRDRDRPRGDRGGHSRDREVHAQQAPWASDRQRPADHIMPSPWIGGSTPLGAVATGQPGQGQPPFFAQPAASEAMHFAAPAFEAVGGAMGEAQRRQGMPPIDRNASWVNQPLHSDPRQPAPGYYEEQYGSRQNSQRNNDYANGAREQGAAPSSFPQRSEQHGRRPDNTADWQPDFSGYNRNQQPPPRSDFGFGPDAGASGRGLPPRHALPPQPQQQQQQQQQQQAPRSQGDYYEYSQQPQFGGQSERYSGLQPDSNGPEQFRSYSQSQSQVGGRNYQQDPSPSVPRAGGADRYPPNSANTQQQQHRPEQRPQYPQQSSQYLPPPQSHNQSSPYPQSGRQQASYPQQPQQGYGHRPQQQLLQHEQSWYANQPSESAGSSYSGGMSARASEPASAPTAPSTASGSGTSASTPDYKSLLQYLQFYQEQMGGSAPPKAKDK